MATPIAPQVVVVDFHHARGPEVEFWVEPVGENLAKNNDWSLLPFMALSDGAHAMLEDFSYFALLDKGDVSPTPAVDKISADVDTTSVTKDAESQNDQSTTTTTTTKETQSPPMPRGKGGDLPATATSLFGIACTRQIKSDRLKRRSASVTRSTVQKAVVVISQTARGMGELRERLGVVTAAWFAQEDFSDITILKVCLDGLDEVSDAQGPDRRIGAL
ncbi:hypothetical protein LTR84_006226 [Exophiala bonariae]|uniref:AVL9/DENND6 domain-containing protein n=1 Tax=Exophiala bonariae TaxID=1690606 RepID=A0AAV9N1W6_9EURO|nr:hypothetical protein LTR84_006226 [Exophiala bonariae]